MTREQLKAMLPEGTEEGTVTRILDALHSENQPHKDAAKKAADDLAAKTKAYDELQAKYDKDVKEANDRAANLAFDGELDGVLRDKGAKNIKAAKALLDIDALKASKDRKKDMIAAADALIADKDSAFLFGAQPTGKKKDVGAATGGGAGQDAVWDAKMRAALGLNTTKKE